LRQGFEAALEQAWMTAEQLSDPLEAVPGGGER